MPGVRISKYKLLGDPQISPAQSTMEAVSKIQQASQGLGDKVGSHALRHIRFVPHGVLTHSLSGAGLGKGQDTHRTLLGDTSAPHPFAFLCLLCFLHPQCWSYLRDLDL